MPNPTDRDKIWTKNDAATELSNRVYEACYLLEHLEYQRKGGGAGIIGNGHHAMQEVAELAKKVLLERWREQEGESDVGL